MKIDTINEKDKQVEELIVIADECGDSMWDAVLGQDVKACQLTKPMPGLDTLINGFETKGGTENNNTK